jgi:hypothetical protein
MFTTSDIKRRHFREFLAFFASILELPDLASAASQAGRDEAKIAANRELYGRMEMALLQA